MLEWVSQSIQQFERLVQWTDLVDIAIVAALLYALLMVLWQRIAPRAVVAVLLFVGVDLLARLLGLGLTHRLIELFTLLLLIAAVVVFQADIRRAVERVGTRRPFAKRRGQPQASPVELLTSVAQHLAQNRVGALIALKGREPWGQAIEGGVELDGQLSEPLLSSIFSPDSPGHDGAVLVEGDRVPRFAAHLPLSSNLAEVGAHGTRHTAGLGLSERTDALVIMVSEEQGTISLAQNGKLRQVDPDALRDELTRFWQDHYMPGGPSRGERNVGRLAAIGLIALGLACALWFAFEYRPQTVFSTYDVPIQYVNLDADAWHLAQAPGRATVILTGPEGRLADVEEETLNVVLDLSDLDPGWNTYRITKSNMRLPRGVELSRVVPEEVRVQAMRVRTVQVPVRVVTQGSLPDPMSLQRVEATPPTATVRIPADWPDVPEYVRTEPIDLSRIRETTEVQARLSPQPDVMLAPDQPGEITVRLEVEREDEEDS